MMSVRAGHAFVFLGTAWFVAAPRVCCPVIIHTTLDSLVHKTSQAHIQSDSAKPCTSGIPGYSSASTNNAKSISCSLTMTSFISST